MWAASQRGSPARRRAQPPSSPVSPWLHGQRCACRRAPVTRRLPPRFLCTNQTGNSLPLPGAPVVAAVTRNNHGPAIRALQRTQNALRRAWGPFCVPRQGVLRQLSVPGPGWETAHGREPGGGVGCSPGQR